MLHETILKTDAALKIKEKYNNYIGGKWVAPLGGEYISNISPITGREVCKVARSKSQDIELALDAAHKAKDGWGRMSVAERSLLLLRIADRMEVNLDILAAAETIDKGKPLRESTFADLPLAVDHLRYFAGCLRAQEGGISEIDHDTVAYHFHEPLGVVGQIIPWNFPLLMALWKLSPALAAGNCVVMKPAEQTPMSIMVLMEIIGDLIPPGVVNIVNGYGVEAGKPLARSPRIAKVAFTGETGTGQLIMQYASENIIPVTLELGGKSANVFFPDILDQDDSFADKAAEGLASFAFNQGEVCTCPSRALIHESIFDEFVERVAARVNKIKGGNPLNMATMVGSQASEEQMNKILSYIEIGKNEGAKLVTGGERYSPGDGLENGYYIKPTMFIGDNSMRIFQEEIFGPVISMTKFSTTEEAIALANDSEFGLAAGVWSRDVNTAYRVGRGIKAGRVWTNCYHLYPAHAAFGGYKKSGIGRESHKMLLEHYQQTKCMLVNYNDQPMGLF